MIDLADAEAACLGNIARTCIHRGTIPPVNLRPLWFTNRGRCVGLRIIGHDEDEFDLDGSHTGADYLAPLRPIVQHLKAYAGEVAETPGMAWALYEWETIRDVYYEMYPSENHAPIKSDPESGWLTLEESVVLLGRRKSTIYSWASQGWVRTSKAEGNPTLYNAYDMTELKANIKHGRPAGEIA